jgi:hypothetical protein
MSTYAVGPGIEQSPWDHPHNMNLANSLGNWQPGYQERSPGILLYFLPPLTCSGLSWLLGGVQLLNDACFWMLCLVLAGLFIRELAVFPRRLGIGGLIVFGGALVWWCYDYGTHWLGFDPFRSEIKVAGAAALGVTSEVLGKALYLHCAFLIFMTSALFLRRMTWVSRLVFRIPEPYTSVGLFLVVLVIFVVSMIPYLFFTEDDFFTAIWKSVTQGYSGNTTAWTAGRTGNVNYSWGGYLTQLVDLGYAGGVLAAFHAILFTRSLLQRGVCLGIFLLQCSLAFGTGARGNFLAVCLPVVILLFLKFNFVAAALAKSISIRSYVAALGLLCLILVMVQWQGQARTFGFTEESFDEVDVADLKGNEMFTTTLAGMLIFPEQIPFMDQPFVGGGALYAVPKTIYWFGVGPIPRALWHGKPIDPLWTKYNSIVTGRSEEDMEGTTISRGAVGSAYFRYGFFGMIQIAFLYGWLLRNVEIGVRYAEDRPLALIAFLGLATFMFRSFRDLNYNLLYPVIYSVILFALFAIFTNAVFGRGVSTR